MKQNRQLATFNETKFSKQYFISGDIYDATYRKFLNKRRGIIVELSLKPCFDFELTETGNKMIVGSLKTGNLCFYSEMKYDATRLIGEADPINVYTSSSIMIDANTPVKELESAIINEANIILERNLEELENTLARDDEEHGVIEMVL